MSHNTETYTDDQDKENVGGHNCAACGKSGCSQRCSRCKSTHYCSRDCQAGDWKTHKANCKKMKKANEKPDQKDGPFAGLFQRMQHMTFPDTSYEATRPKGSLEKAKAIVRRKYPGRTVLDNLSIIENEALIVERYTGGYFFVAFMFKYHPYPARHGIIIKDRKGKETVVHFYIDYDNPAPYFSYDQVKPGNYLCLCSPLMHYFLDGSTGIRIDDASDVDIIDGHSLV